MIPIQNSSPESITNLNIHEQHIRKRRVGKACDSCRIKKTKCDGKKPCSKCLLDNKICIYSERKRSKDKNYPPGYVELLETRLDLLSKSLEKLVNLSINDKDLSFLKTICNSNSNENNDDNENNINNNVEHSFSNPDPKTSNSEIYDDSIARSESKINVNYVIQYLISENGLLDNQPIEWETGSKIAASLPSDLIGIQEASKQFAQHIEQTNSKVPKSKQSQSAQNLNLNLIRQQLANNNLNNGNRPGNALSKLNSRDNDSSDTSPVKEETLPAINYTISNSTNEEDFLNNDFNFDYSTLKHNFNNTNSNSTTNSNTTSNTNTPTNMNNVTLANLNNINSMNNLSSKLVGLGGYPSGMALATAAINGELSMSDFESDNSIYNQTVIDDSLQNINDINNDTSDDIASNHNKNDNNNKLNNSNSEANVNSSNTKSLFIETNLPYSNSLTSLTSNFEKQSLNSPNLNLSSTSVNNSNGNTAGTPTTIKRSSSLTKPYSPSVQKKLNVHHISKPIHHNYSPGSILGHSNHSHGHSHLSHGTTSNSSLSQQQFNLNMTDFKVDDLSNIKIEDSNDGLMNNVGLDMDNMNGLDTLDNLASLDNLDEIDSLWLTKSLS